MPTQSNVKGAIDKKDMRRTGNRMKPGTTGNEDRQEEDAAEVLSEWDGDEMSATELEGDPAADHGAGGGSTSGSSASTLASLASVTLSSTDIENIIEASQSKIGKFLLDESDRRWEKKATALLDKHDHRMTQRLAAAEKEFSRNMDERIEARAKESDRKMEAMLEEAKAAASAASEALAQIRGENKSAPATSTTGGRYYSESAAGGQRTYDSYQVWVPKTMEIKGICDYGARFTSGVSSDYADGYLSKLEEKLQGADTPIDWSRSRASTRFSFNFNIVLVLNDPPPNSPDKDWLDSLRDLKSRVGQALQDDDMKINGATCFAALQAAPWRREFYAAAGKMTGALMALAGSKVSDTKREYTKGGATLVYSLAAKAGDKNSALLKGSGAQPTWRRLGSWNSRTSQWSFDASELTRLGLTQGELEEKSKTM